MNASPTKLSLDHLRAHGWTVDVVERWVPALNVRRDLFGMFDLLAVRGGETLAVQVTSRSEIARRVRKIGDAEALPAVRSAGWTLLVHGWDQPGGKGRAYRLKEVDVS